ncbi:hypothetical protein C9439_07985 [archaeon SCG-AAA382B04]|nr:hypothetical protein C9439_07985 [archaeon SCG-AAA382B04]
MLTKKEFHYLLSSVKLIYLELIPIYKMVDSGTFVMDKESEEELEKLANLEGKSKSKIVREAIKERYMKQKRAEENLDFYIDLYNKEIITKDLLTLLLPKKDVEAIIIGSETGKEAASVAKETNN